MWSAGREGGDGGLLGPVRADLSSLPHSEDDVTSHRAGHIERARPGTDRGVWLSRCVPRSAPIVSSSNELAVYHFFVHEVKSLQCFALYVASLSSGAAMSCRRRE